MSDRDLRARLEYAVIYEATMLRRMQGHGYPSEDLVLRLYEAADALNAYEDAERAATKEVRL